MANINLITLNVKGLNNTTKRLSLFNFLKEKKGNIIFLQETHSDPTIEHKWSNEWDGHVEFCHGSSNSKGVMILFNIDAHFKINEIKRHNEGRFLVVDCNINEQTYIFCCVYAPTKDKQNDQLNFLEEIISVLSDYKGTNLFLAGDLNTYLNPVIDKKGGTSKPNSKYTDLLLEFIEELNLVDIWRIRNENKKQFTFRQKTKYGLVQCRLDYFLISRQLEYFIDSAIIEPSIKTDHSLVKLKVKINTEQDRGRGIWKFNSNLLLDNTYTDLIKNCILNAKEDCVNLKDKHIYWDYIKSRIRDETISYSIIKNKNKNIYKADLESRLLKLEESVSTVPDVNNLDEYFLVKNELESIYNEQAQGAIIRSRCQIVEEAERNTKYFLALAKHNYEVKHIKSHLVNNQIVSEPKQILLAQKDFYKNLYSDKTNSSYNTIETYLSNISSPKVPETCKSICDGAISEEKIFKALSELPNNKTPGLDDFSIEFYNFFGLN